MRIKYYFYKQYKIKGSNGATGAMDAKYIYIKVVGEEPVAAAVLALKRDPFGMLTKKVGDDIQKSTIWLEM